MTELQIQIVESPALAVEIIEEPVREVRVTLVQQGEPGEPGEPGTTDHGALDGLLDDDHPHYHNDTRGDIRYYTKTLSDARYLQSIPSSYATDAELSQAITDHEGQANPHPVYLTQAEADALYKVIGYAPAWTEITAKPSTFPPEGHNHDDRYFTETESDARYLQSVPSSYATDAELAAAISAHEAASNPHAIYLTQAEGDALYKALGYVPTWTEITGKPSTFPPSAHEHDHIVPIAEDTYAETDPIDDWPEGISEMAASDTADWNGSGVSVVVETLRSGSDGMQIANFRGYLTPHFRTFDPLTPDWNPWQQAVTGDDITNAIAGITTIQPRADDTYAESTTPINYYGFTHFRVSAGANWGPNSGEAGFVIAMTVPGSPGAGDISQLFYADNGNSYRRVSASSTTWSSWQAFSMDGHTHSYDDLDDVPTSFTPSAHASTHTNGTDDIQSATASQKGLATAAQITKLDGIETGATADQTPSEILSALLTVDGSGSNVDADKLDGLDSTAFLQSAYYQTIKEGGTARTQRAAINFGNGLDAVDDSGNNETDVSVDESELTHNSLGGLTAGDPHTQYHTDARGDARYPPLARSISTTAPLSGGGDLSANRTLAVSTATETAEGVSERATQAETDAGTDDARYLSALKLATTPRLPTQGENDALVGTSGTASSTNKYVTDADSRNTNARTPTSHATSHVTGGSDVIANAVASGNSGLLSGSDKAKLDGIETGATADQTASEILTALLTVDGSGSGLDADKLDNHDTSYFLDRTNHTGTQTAATVSFSPTGTVASTDVQSAIAEVASEAGGGSTGEATLNFGTFPGASDTSVAVGGQSSIASGSIVEAWIMPEATVEHSADEHLMEELRVIAANVVAGVGFTIYGMAEGTTRLYGRWNIAWRWS